MVFILSMLVSCSRIGGATIFCILISGLFGIAIPLLLNSFNTLFIAFLAFRSEFAPAHTILPLEKMRSVALGLLMR